MRNYIVGSILALGLLLGIFLLKLVLYPELDSTLYFLAALISLSIFLGFIYIFSTQAFEQIKEQEKEIKKQSLHLAKIEGKLHEAEREIKSRDEFLSIASHELKTPLTSMLLQIQSILRSIHHVSLAEFSVANLLKLLESAELQTKRLSKMINDLLNVSLITTGRIDMKPEKIDLVQLVKDVSDGFKEELEHDNISLKIDADKPVVGSFDKLRIEQAYSNLLTNAIKYGDKKPIEVRVSNSDSFGRILVKDNGIGIQKDKQDKIFERFKRAVDKSSSYQGLGVGLYITHQIVNAHNGEITVKSKPGKGSEFEIKLPLV